MANLAMGVDLAPLEKTLNFDKAKVIQQAEGVTKKRDQTQNDSTRGKCDAINVAGLHPLVVVCSVFVCGYAGAHTHNC